MGWYAGLGGRLRLHVGPLNGVQQPPCPSDPNTGLIACNWAPSYTLTVPSDWTSGVYLALLTNAQGYQNYVMFVVRDGRPAPFLYQQSVTTDQAYNNYPNDNLTGKSLYTYNSYGAKTVAGDPRAVKVSFDRPLADSGTGFFFTWDVTFVRWLERSGYDVTYSTDIDMHANGGELKNHKAFLIVGHGEYWSKEMFDAAEAARDAGVNLGFFAADTVSAQVRFEPSAAGVANRVMVCYKVASLDPVQGPTTTVPWRFPPVNRPEQPLRGILSNVTYTGNFTNYVVANSSHWVYAGTGVKDGDVVPGMVGYEVDSYQPSYPPPNTANQTLLSQSPFTTSGGGTGYANASIYQAPSGAWVFSAGTFAWSWRLDTFFSGQADSRIQQTTANILNAFLTGTPVVKVLVGEAPATVTAGQAFTMVVTAENDQGNPVTQYSGTVHFSSSDTSAGVVLPADATLTNGQGTFSATLIKVGPQTVTVADAENSLSTTVTVIVTAGSATRISLGVPAAVIKGTAFTVNVTLKDQFGNVATGYAGTVHFGASAHISPLEVLPPDYTFTSNDAGSRSFSVTLWAPSRQTISVMDTADSSLTDTSPTITVGVRLPGEKGTFLKIR
ncbi:MAG: Ig-like domain repeat protein [Nitrospirae bacterium]|nr:MAG: Ig-like domain repeat protein [Nitrospirota bacterium]